MNCDFGPAIDGWFICQRCGHQEPTRGMPRLRAECHAIDLAAVPRRRRSEPCGHLGAQHSWRECNGCAGNTRLKIYGCTAGHGDVEIGYCQRDCPDYEPIAALGGARRKLLVRFWHGLGDHIQLGIVFRHLRAAHPQWQLFLAGHVNKAAALRHLVDGVYEFGHEPASDEFDACRMAYFYEPETAYCDSPATKAEKCLREIFGIQPIERLCSYSCRFPEACAERVRRWACGRRFALLHLIGHTARERKDADVQAMQAAARAIRKFGVLPLVLDLERHGQVDADRITPDDAVWAGAWDSATICALAAASSLNIGIDSGPGKIFGSVPTPGIILWSGMHPIHYQGLAGNLTHLVPRYHAELIYGAREIGLDYFSRRYDYRVAVRNTAAELVALVEEKLDVRPAQRRDVAA